MIYCVLALIIVAGVTPANEEFLGANFSRRGWLGWKLKWLLPLRYIIVIVDL